MELPDKQHCQFLPIQSIHLENSPNGLNWQCCLAGSSKTAPRILIFSIAMGANYSCKLIFFETYSPQYIGDKKFFLGSVMTSVSFLVRILLSWCVFSERSCSVKSLYISAFLPEILQKCEQNSVHMVKRKEARVKTTISLNHALSFHSAYR